MDNNFKELHKNKIVIVGNKPPMTPVKREGKIVLERSVGGLTCALEPLVRKLNGKWFCTIPKEKKERYAILKGLPYEVHMLELTEQEVNHYYEGFSNNELWPICHYFPTHMVVGDDDWEVYRSVNEKMADLICENISENDYIWVNDYHFFLLPSLLRQKIPKLKIGFFLHIPFPNQEIFRILANRKELLLGLLGADLIGFHTKQYMEHFKDCLLKLIPDIHLDQNRNKIYTNHGKITLSYFPISTDYAFFSQKAASSRVKKKVADLKKAYHSELIGISIDRLDYSKGPLERLLAIEKFFDMYPEYIGKITFIQVAVPSREHIEAYRYLKQQVDETTGRISGKFSIAGWAPVHYLYETLETEDLIAYYALGDIALVIPLRDGMNLVSKEYVASRTDKNGVLILSEFTGAKEELKDALLVNPYHKCLVAKTIKRAIEMSSGEKRERMENMQKIVKQNDLYNWVENYLKAFFDSVRTRGSGWTSWIEQFRN